MRARPAMVAGDGGAAAGTDEAVGDGPFEERQIQLRAGIAHQRKGADFLDRLHDDDGRGGVDENLEAFEWAGGRIHMYLTGRELLPYNINFGSYRNILLEQSRANKGNQAAWRTIFRR